MEQLKCVVPFTVNAFDHMEFGLVIHLTMVDNRAVTWPSIIASRYVNIATTLNTR